MRSDIKSGYSRIGISLIVLVLSLASGNFVGSFADDSVLGDKKIYEDPLFGKFQFDTDSKLRDFSKRLSEGANKNDIRKEYKELIDKAEKQTAFFKAAAREIIFGTLISKAISFFPVEAWCELYKKYRIGDEAPFKDSKIYTWEQADKYYKLSCVKKKKEGGSLGFRECRPGLPKLEEVLSTGSFAVRLLGDGTTTSSALLLIENTDTGMTLATDIATVCASTRSDLPPQPADIVANDNVRYSIGKADPLTTAIVRSSRQLAKEGQYSNLGLTEAETQVRQLAIWKRNGAKTGDPKDTITDQSVKAWILGNIQLTPAETQAVDQKVAMLLSSVDLTLKRSSEFVDPQPEKKPEQPLRGSEPPFPTKPQLGSEPPLGSVPPFPPKPQFAPDPLSAENLAYVPLAPGQGYIEVCVPSETSFIPSIPRYQEMDTTQDQVAHVPVLISGAGKVLLNTTQPKLYTPFQDKNTGKWGYKDKDGNIVLPPQFEEAGLFVDYVAPVKIRGSWFLINVLGETISENFDGMGTIADGLVPVMRRTKKGATETVESWGYINTRGRKIIPIGTYEEAADFHNGIARVKTSSGWGLIDKDGKEIVKPRFERIGQPSDGVALVVKGGKFGFVDLKNILVVPPKYDEAQPFVHGRSVVKVGGKFGIIDTSGKEIVKPEYEFIETFKIRAGNSPTAIIEKDGKRQLIDVDGKVTSGDL